MNQTRRKRHSQLAAPGLLPLALMKPNLDLVQFRLTHDPRQAQEQPVMIRSRIVQTFAIGNQHTKQRAELEKLMPIPIVARQTRGIQTDD